MVAETVWVALVSGGSAVAAAAVTAYINRQNNQDQIEAQQRQLETRLEAEKESRRAEFYIDHKVEALEDLFNAVSELHFTFVNRGPFFEKNDAEALTDHIEEFDRALNRAVIYLGSDASTKFQELLDSYEDFVQVLLNTPNELNVEKSRHREIIENFEREIEENSIEDIDSDVREEFEQVAELYEYQSSHLDWKSLAENTGEVQYILEKMLAEPIEQFESE